MRGSGGPQAAGRSPHPTGATLPSAPWNRMFLLPHPSGGSGDPSARPRPVAPGASPSTAPVWLASRSADRPDPAAGRCRRVGRRQRPRTVDAPQAAPGPARSRSAITTLAPSAAKRCAMPRPMPEAAPVTIAVFPFKRTRSPADKIGSIVGATGALILGHARMGT